MSTNLEEMYVKDVYNKIAKEFSNTRYRSWTCVEKFLKNMEANQLIGDIGCGNGKNMLYRSEELRYKGCDFSEELVKISCDKGLNVIYGDILSIPFPNDHFDNVMCIAVIHHLSKEEDRQKAVNELIRVTKSGGNILILVWALKQDKDSRRKFDTQDIFVDWKDKYKNILGKRYYHIFKNNELEALIDKKKSKIIESFYEMGNYGVVITKV